MTKGLLIAILFLPFNVKGQKLNNCQALESLLKYVPAVRSYYFDKNISYPIIFYDTTGVFNNCSVSNYYNRKIEVFNKLPDSCTSEPSDYIIIAAEKSRKKLLFTLSYKSSGAYCDFVMRKKGKIYKVIKFRERYL